MRSIWRNILEVGFILFLFYSNLLMGEFTRSGLGQNKGFVWSIQNIFTITNLIIGVVLALVGHLVFGFFRNRL
ncbi:MAG: hypothetical protein ACXVPU_09130 [Bacteroidia bacterium]